MSRRIREREVGRLRAEAPVFAALGDKTRLLLLTKLTTDSRCSITYLTAGSRLTRQAISKHLRVLEEAGLVRSERRGRESLYALEPQQLHEAQRALDRISSQWDEAIARLKTFVE